MLAPFLCEDTRLRLRRLKIEVQLPPLRLPVFDKHLFDDRSWLPVLINLRHITLLVKEPYEEEERFVFTAYAQDIEAWKRMLPIFLSYIDTNMGNCLKMPIKVDWGGFKVVRTRITQGLVKEGLVKSKWCDMEDQEADGLFLRLSFADVRSPRW